MVTITTILIREGAMVSLRVATATDFDAIWNIFHEIALEGETYPDDATCTPQQAREMWLGLNVHTVVACADEYVVGAYRLVPNMPGRGSHVANGSYIVAAAYRGRGIGHALVHDSLQAAKQAGYTAIQFNFVVSTNHAALKLYASVGFQILATLPQAFHHPRRGYVDAFLMHRSLAHEHET